MEIYEYLKKDHQKVADLFQQFEKADELADKIELVIDITKELTLHATSEQETFYKALEKFNDTKDEALHGEKEHKEIEERLDKISKLEASSPAWEKIVLELKEFVQHHVDEEEKEFFDKAKKVLSREQAQLITKEMQDYKEQMLQEL